jgi:uncharacterized repeat protein (TIGR01451 family)
MRLARLLPLFVVLLLVSCFAAHADEPLPDRPDVRSAPSTDIDLGIEALPPKGPPNLESSLWRLVEAQRSGGPAGLSAEAERSAIALEDGAVRVIVEAREGQSASAIASARSLGATLETSYGDLVQVLAPVGNLEALSNSDGVRFVRQPTKYFPATITGEGVGIVNADDWHAAGVTGSGVKVAVLDLGFAGYTGLLGTELPASVTAQSFRADGDITGGGEVHGTAVAEIVHEVAPGAQIYLVNFQTDPELANAVNWIVSQGVKVINASWGCSVCGPGNGTGFESDLVTNSIASGVQWAIAAGNQADSHWRGSWYNPDGDSWHNFTLASKTNPFYLAAGESASVGLKWDDPWAASCNDYDLCIFDDAGGLVGCSENWQNCAADPVEGLVLTTYVSAWYHAAIFRYSATRAPYFHLYVLPEYSPPDLLYVSPDGSLSIPADNPSALSIGAVPWSSPNTIEPFSSQGPTEDGRIKPDLVAPDYVSGATYGPSGFPGTSAASPHVAGAAALVKQAYPSYTPAQIKSFLEGRAVPLGAAGKDNIYGSGRLDLGSPPLVDLTITKSASPADGSNVSTGATITYTLTASNAAAATATATNVVIRDYIGTGLTFVSATPGSGVTCGDTTPPEINCTVASIAPGESRTATIVATVAATNGTVLNGARVDPANAIPESNEDADDPDRVCAEVGEGTDAGDATEPDNFDCTGHTVTVQACGDVNCDGDVDAVDALFILQYVVGLRDGSNECPAPAGAMYLPACDVDCDYDCDAVDALFVLQYVVGIRPDLCVCLSH